MRKHFKYTFKSYIFFLSYGKWLTGCSYVADGPLMFPDIGLDKTAKRMVID